MRRNRAFTLIELMVVILILAILAALVVPNVLGKTGQAKVAKAKADLAVLRDAIDQFRIDCDRYPSTQEGFDALRNKPNGVNGWNGPYLTKDLGTDPWGNAYTYSTPGPSGKGGYIVESFGSDGVAGGDGDAADILDGADN